MPLISCNNISFGTNTHPLVSGLSFEVNSGDFVLLIKENNAATNALIDILFAIKRPLSGSITYGERFRPRDISFLAPQLKLKGFGNTAMEVVLSGCLKRHRYSAFYTKKDKDDAAKNLVKLGMLEYANRNYRELSEGQQQRVLLARALCEAGKLLILDEPEAGLDTIATNELYSTLEKLNRYDKLSIILATRDDGAQKNSTHILKLFSEPSFSKIKKDYVSGKEPIL